jgi:hypothetical protein
MLHMNQSQVVLLPSEILFLAEGRRGGNSLHRLPAFVLHLTRDH